MTESHQSESPVARYAGPVAEALLRDAQAWTALQCELLCGLEALWAECARRQTDAIENSARLLQGFCDGRGAVELVQIQRGWLASAARRSAAVIGQWAGDGAAGSRETVGSAAAALAAANESARPALPGREAAE